LKKGRQWGILILGEGRQLIMTALIPISSAAETIP